MMLKADERNFHCWNYRLWAVELYLEEMEKRLVAFKMSDHVQRAKCDMLEKECEMAEGIIRKNFANFSAWHYRSKLMPQIYIRDPDNIYSMPLSKIKSDLEMLKHAFFTDPKDQGSWNYHEWLINQITPIQVVGLRYEEASILVGLSHKVSHFDQLDI